MKRCAWVSFVLLVSCGGTTGGSLVEFDARVLGPTVDSAGTYDFSTPVGYQVRLDTARIYIGAVYLNLSRPASVNADTSCFLPGVYAAELTRGREFDLLRGTPIAFPVRGSGTNEVAQVGELWLTSGAVDAPSDSTVIASFSGVAIRGGDNYPFEGRVTISHNRLPPVQDPAQPGARPICKQRVVTPLDASFSVRDGGTLEVHVDPAGWFRNVDFALLDRVSDSPPLYEFRDDSTNPPSLNLFTGLRASDGTYRLKFINKSN
jgi:hypothetical protein